MCDSANQPTISHLNRNQALLVVDNEVEGRSDLGELLLAINSEDDLLIEDLGMSHQEPSSFHVILDSIRGRQDFFGRDFPDNRGLLLRCEVDAIDLVEHLILLEDAVECRIVDLLHLAFHDVDENQILLLRKEPSLFQKDLSVFYCAASRVWPS